MAENNSSATFKTAEGAYPALPEPVDQIAQADGFNVIGPVDVYTAEQMRAYAAQAVAAQAAPSAVAVPAVVDSFSACAIADSNYAAGMLLGWNLCVTDDSETFSRIRSDRMSAAIQASRAARATQALPATEPAREAVADSLRDAFLKGWDEHGKAHDLSPASRHLVIELMNEVYPQATPALPATEDSSAGDLARHGMTPRDKATQDQIAAVMLQHGTPAQQLQAMATCCNVSADCIKAMVAAAQAEVQAEPVAAGIRLGRAEIRAGKVGYFAFEQTDLDDGDYFLYTAPQAQPAFQQRVQPWMMECFGAEIAADRIERNHRFLEEALELVQSTGCTQSEAHQLVDYVYGRPWGEPTQEVGGVMVTLAALCLANGLDMHQAGETELARIWTKVDAIRAKQAAKPKHSPLPQAQPADALDAKAPTLVEILAAHWTTWPAEQAVEQTVLGDVFCCVKGRALKFGTYQIASDQDSAVVTPSQWTRQRAAMAAAQEGGNAAKEA